MTKGLWGTCGWGDTCLLWGGQAPTPGRLHCSFCIQTHGSWGGGAAQHRGLGGTPAAAWAWMLPLLVLPLLVQGCMQDPCSCSASVGNELSASSPPP